MILKMVTVYKSNVNDGDICDNDDIYDINDITDTNNINDIYDSDVCYY